MTKTRNATKRALFFSFVSMFICFAMLLGTTYAWFTDSVNSGINQIVAGNLDVELYHTSNTVPNGEKVASDTVLFTLPGDDAENNIKQTWEPGAMVWEKFTVKNEGDLALKYEFSLNVANAKVVTDASGNNYSFADMLKVYVVYDENFEYSRSNVAAIPANDWSNLASLSEPGTLGAGEEKAYGIIIYWMPSDNDNLFNMNNGKEEGSVMVDVGVNLYATQVESERDSFGTDYDNAAALSGSTSGAAPAIGQTATYTVYNSLKSQVLSEITVYGASIEDPTKPVEISIEPTAQDASVTVQTSQNAKTFNISVSNIKEGNTYDISTTLYVGKDLAGVTLYHNDEEIESNYDPATGFVSFDTTSFSPYTVVWDKPLVTINEVGYYSIADAMVKANDGDTLVLRAGYNTTDAPLTETIVVDKDVTLIPNGMYLVSAAPATFTVVEGGKLTVEEGSFTIKNTATNGTTVLVDGGEFVMKGGSFDGHTAVRTTEGKSSTVTLAAGWSNRVTVGFDLKGNDTLNVTGGSLYTSNESVKTVSGNHLNLNMSGGLLSSRTTQYSAAVNLLCTATVNMTGGTIENTYSSGANGSPAIKAHVSPTTINLSGTAKLSSNGTTVILGSTNTSPAVQEERFVLTVDGDSQISAVSAMGFGIRYAQDCCDVTIKGNAKINATFQAIQFNTNNYVYTNSTLTIAENANITSTAGKYGGGYGVAANGNVTITGGTIYGSTAGVASFQEGSIVTIDNSVSGTPITINKTDINEAVTYTVAGNPTIG